MPKLPAIERTSLTEPLVARYNAAPTIANVGGGSAKSAGTHPSPPPTAAVRNPSSQAIQSDFTPEQPLQVTEFQPAALNYAATIGVDAIKYSSK